LVYADIALIDRALQNIIDNAIAHCKKGDVITLELSRDEQDVKITISDTGCGIAEQEIPHIFERYRKGKFLSNNKEGSGLGLAIVKRIMDLHNINIGVRSAINQGTAFFFSLPVHKRLQTS